MIEQCFAISTHCWQDPVSHNPCFVLLLCWNDGYERLLPWLWILSQLTLLELLLFSQNCLTIHAAPIKTSFSEWQDARLCFRGFVCESNFDLGSDQVGGERMRTKFPGIVVTTSVLQPAFEYRKCLTIILLSLQMSHCDKKKKYPIFLCVLQVLRLIVCYFYRIWHSWHSYLIVEIHICYLSFGQNIANYLYWTYSCPCFGTGGIIIKM